MQNGYKSQNFSEESCKKKAQKARFYAAFRVSQTPIVRYNREVDKSDNRIINDSGDYI